MQRPRKLKPVILTDPQRFWVDDWQWQTGRFDYAFHKYALSDHLTQLRALRDYLTYNRTGNNSYSTQMVGVFEYLGKGKFAKHRPSLFADIRAVVHELKSGSSAVLRRLVERMIETFPSADYLDWLIDQITSDLEQTVTDVVLDRISSHSGAAIAHLFATGFGWAFIRDIPRNVLERDIELDDGAISTQLPEFPLSPPTTDGTSTESAAAWDTYNTEAAAYLNGLTVSQRISQIKAYLRQPKVERRYIFRVKGAQGLLDLSVGSVEFYSPTVHRFIPLPVDSSLRWETFNDRQYDGFNAAVVMASVEPSGGAARAAQSIEAALNVLKIAINTETSLRIDPKSFLALRLDGAPLIIASGSNEEALQRILMPNVENMLEESRDSVKRVGDLLAQAGPESVAHKKVLVGLQSFRKVRESARPEDRLSDAWTILELLIDFDRPAFSGMSGGIENTIAEFMSVVEARRTFALKVRELMEELRTAIFRDEHDLSGRKDLPFSDDLLNRLQVRSVVPFDVQIFRDALDDGRAATPNLHLKRRFARVKALLSNSEDEAKHLAAVRSQIDSEIRAIYQLRNQIVHSGYVNLDTVVPYAKRCEALATLALAIAISAEAPGEIDQRLLDDYSAGKRLLELMNPKFIQAVDVTLSEIFRKGGEAY